METRYGKRKYGFVDMTGWVMAEHGVPNSWLTVLELAEPYISPSDGHKRQQWLCRCKCGKEFVTLGHRIRKGIVLSCGCKPPEFSDEWYENVKKSNSTHGDSGTRLYKCWHGIRLRCNNPQDQHYPLYGGRGISVCKEWDESYEAFRDWALANGYADGLSIDRIDVDGNYKPSNCRWATNQEQQNNKRTNVYLTFNGKTQTIVQWAREVGINPVTLNARIRRYRWSVERALTEQVKSRHDCLPQA